MYVETEAISEEFDSVEAYGKIKDLKYFVHNKGDHYWYYIYNPAVKENLKEGKASTLMEAILALSEWIGQHLGE